jgi:hypothetical protein
MNLEEFLNRAEVLEGAPARYFEVGGLVDERNLLTKEDLEAMRQEFGAGVWDAYGRPISLDDELH